MGSSWSHPQAKCILFHHRHRHHQQQQQQQQHRCCHVRLLVGRACSETTPRVSVGHAALVLLDPPWVVDVKATAIRCAAHVYHACLGP